MWFKRPSWRHPSCLRPCRCEERHRGKRLLQFYSWRCKEGRAGQEKRALMHVNAAECAHLGLEGTNRGDWLHGLIAFSKTLRIQEIMETCGDLDSLHIRSTVRQQRWDGLRCRRSEDEWIPDAYHCQRSMIHAMDALCMCMCKNTMMTMMYNNLHWYINSIWQYIIIYNSIQ